MSSYRLTPEQQAETRAYFGDIEKEKVAAAAVKRAADKAEKAEKAEKAAK